MINENSYRLNENDNEDENMQPSTAINRCLQLLTNRVAMISQS